MLAGVLSCDERAVSPYGGQNVAAENLFAPLRMEGLHVADKETAKLEFRVYGGFGHGLALYPQATLFECLRFSQEGQALLEAGNCDPTIPYFASNDGFKEVAGRDLFLEAGDTLRLAGTVQFSGSVTPTRVECRSRLMIQGPDEERSTFSQKNLEPHKPSLALGGSLTHRVEKSGRYHISLQAGGSSSDGSVSVLTEPQLSQLHFLHYR